MSWAAKIAPHQPSRARELAREAFVFAAAFESARTQAFAHSEGMRVAWAIEPREEAVRASLTALDVIERLRNQQTAASTRAALFSTWVSDYQWLVGTLLERHLELGEEDDLRLAFEVSERLRGRVLLEALDAAAVAPQVPAELQERRSAVLRAISTVQSRLLAAPEDPREREALALELRHLETEEDVVEEDIARLNPAWAGVERPDFATLGEVRRALGPTEALLVFQVAPWEDIYRDFAGGSWVLVVTRDAVRVHPLRDLPHLEQRIELLLGALPGRSGREAPLARGLHRALLAAALADLPAEIDRLVVVPDGLLHNLPLGLLQDPDGGAPLAGRYRLSRVPSATLWLRWRQRPAPAPPLPALVLADPELAPAGDAAGEEGALRPRAGPALGASSPGLPPTRGGLLQPLPQARQEGRAVRRHLGCRVRLREGRQATERGLLDEPDLGAFGLLHFAAHATADREQPERSAVYLAAGGSERDGLLQVREIVDLRLDGRTVVLSACDTASGQLLRGEGVLDLARAFFQAGAHAVVASLWPLRDDDAALLFEAFYRYLGRGATVSEALAAAQLERIRAGAPAAAWAGLVVLGDGEVVPYQRPPAERVPAAPVLLATTLLWAAALAVAARSRRPLLDQGRG